MGAALVTVVREGKTFSNLGLQISNFRPVLHSRVEATARVIRRGSTGALLECDMHDDDGRHVARLASSCLFRRLRGE
ncbi:MAG: PaaI family thioesterase [Holophagales bacterium]|nr:PaaI family thioesterase [Holophagales bacterium]